MVLVDVNILIYAHREDSPRHPAYQKWMEQTVSSGMMFSVPSIVRSGFLRLVTNPRIFPSPTPLETALAVLAALTDRPNHVETHPGERHWGIFIELCRETDAKGGLVADAYLAALAIEVGAEWITADRDYSRFPGLKWKHPLDKRR